jgi:hypothetical protein
VHLDSLKMLNSKNCISFNSQKSFFSLQLYIHTLIHTYIPLPLYPRRGSRGILDIPLRRPRFTKVILFIYLWVMLQTWQVASPSPSDRSLTVVEMLLILESPFTTFMEESEALFFYFVPDTTRHSYESLK